MYTPRRFYGFAAAAALVAAAVAFAPSVFSQGGGIPARPRFTSAGVGINAPPGTGELAVSSALLPDVDNGANVGAPASRFSNLYASALCDGACASGAIASSSGTNLLLGAGSSWAAASLDKPLTLSSMPLSLIAPSARVVLNDSSGAQSAWVNFLDAGVSEAYIGLDNIASNLCSGTAAGDLCIRTTGGSALRFSSTDGVSSVDFTPEQGSITLSFDDACTTTSTAVMKYQRIGNIVTAAIGSWSGVCTGDSPSFATSGAPIPANLRPTAHGASVSTSPLFLGFTDAGATTAAFAYVTNAGNISLQRVNIGSSVNVQVTSWTASGNRNLPTQPFVFSYMLGNP